MAEVIGVGGPFKEAQMVESLWVLANWLVKSALQEKKRPQIPINTGVVASGFCPFALTVGTAEVTWSLLSD